MKGLLNAQVHWKVDTQSAINFEYNNSYQESTYENGKEIPIKISADTKITEPTTVTLTADYTIKMLEQLQEQNLFSLRLLR